MPDLLLFLLQLGIILLAARALGWLFRKIHQPQVVGEMVAGILLGPSLLGWAAPGLSAALFPTESLGFLGTLSQLGLVLFMFLIGLELDHKMLRSRTQAAVKISIAGIAFPFLSGVLLSIYLFPRILDHPVTLLNFAVFMGTAMSITAFPVLARILSERNLLRTELGGLAITAAAVDDVCGWVLLAAVVVLSRASSEVLPLGVTLLGILVYLVIMLYPIRRLLRRVDTIAESREGLSNDLLAVLLLVVLFSALATEWLGIHAVFGAFLAGVIMPKGDKFVQALRGKLNDLAVVLLVPIFFAFTGLRSSIGLVQGSELWFYTLLIILIAVLGKFGGVSIIARWSGLPWRESSALGVLMNARGLMELVLLNIGLDLGILSPELFAMMVLMALVTTFMTVPLLNWLYSARHSETAMGRKNRVTP